MESEKRTYIAIEKRRAFIINFVYFAIILFVSIAVIKYGLPMISPFVIAFVIASLLRKPIRFLADAFRISDKWVAILMVLLVYSTIGFLLSLVSVKALMQMKNLLGGLPVFYAIHVEPVLVNIFSQIEQLVSRMDASLVAALRDQGAEFLKSVGQMVSSLSMSAVGGISGAAYSLPGMFIRLLLMIISTFFITIDYERLTGFCMRQLNDDTKAVFLQVKEYVVGTLFVCIRSYAFIMSLTFLELALGLSIIGVKNAIMIALTIAVFDVLPVLGTGGIMIPWVVLTAVQGNYPMALALLLVYLVITIIRNIIEPKIVGSQIGLHPVVTLICIFVGAQLFGVLGLFGFPIGLSLLRHLNETGTIKLFKMAETKQ